MSAPSLLFADNLRDAGVPHAFTTRSGGTSRGPFTSLNLGRGVGDDPAAVARNRSTVLTALGLLERQHIEAQQVHGSAVAVVAVDDGGHILDGVDGLITADPDVVVAVHAADCVPVLLADPHRRVVAAVHTGWRGIAAGVIVEAVAGMVTRFGSVAAELLAASGPSIGPCCYEVDDPVIAQLRRWSWWEGVVQPNARGRWQLDLRAATYRQLLESGLLERGISTFDLCTKCRPDLFFSYRRDGTTGRMAGLIAPPSPNDAPPAEA